MRVISMASACSRLTSMLDSIINALPGDAMKRSDLILAAMSVADGGLYTPVQVQKLFFLMDREIPDRINGPLFNFEPYNYGPFDPAVYRELEKLHLSDMVQLVPQGTWSSYR